MALDVAYTMAAHEWHVVSSQVPPLALACRQHHHLLLSSLRLQLGQLHDYKRKETSTPFGINCNEKPSVIPGSPETA